MTQYRYAILSDTHGAFHPELPDIMAGVEAIFHAGDVVGFEIMEALKAIAPVYAVRGNCDDGSLGLPLEQRITLPFGNLAMVHGDRLPEAKEKRMRAMINLFEDVEPRIIVFGHSHHPYLDFTRNTYLVNPGSAGPPRFREQSSLVLLTWDEATNLFRFEWTPLRWR